jgi:hypothetical protein
MTMRCAEESGWPEREFTLHAGDYVCSRCGWMQDSFAGGCAELCLDAIWHSNEDYNRYAVEARAGGYQIPDAPRRAEIR